jgi:hypothetical protein
MENDSRLRQVHKRHIVGWYTYDGNRHLSTWAGETALYIMNISPENYNGHLWHASPDVDYFEFTEKMEFKEMLKVAEAVNGTLVIAFK